MILLGRVVGTTYNVWVDVEQRLMRGLVQQPNGCLEWDRSQLRGKATT